jgi:hypothetical protein
MCARPQLLAHPTQRRQWSVSTPSSALPTKLGLLNIHGAAGWLSFSVRQPRIGNDRRVTTQRQRYLIDAPQHQRRLGSQQLQGRHYPLRKSRGD